MKKIRLVEEAQRPPIQHGLLGTHSGSAEEVRGVMSRFCSESFHGKASTDCRIAETDSNEMDSPGNVSKDSE